MVERVIGFQDELRFDALGNGNILGNSRIEGDEIGEIKSVSAKSWSAVGTAIAVIIQVKIDETGVGLPGLSREYSAKFPATHQITPAV